MKIFLRFLNRRKAEPMETAELRVYRYAVRQLEARRALGLDYPQAVPPYHREENASRRQRRVR